MSSKCLRSLSPRIILSVSSVDITPPATNSLVFPSFFLCLLELAEEIKDSAAPRTHLFPGITKWPTEFTLLLTGSTTGTTNSPFNFSHMLTFVSVVPLLQSNGRSQTMRTGLFWLLYLKISILSLSSQKQMQCLHITFRCTT